MIYVKALFTGVLCHIFTWYPFSLITAWFTWDPYFSDDRSPSHVVVKPTLHEQEDGTILAMCITGTGSEDSLRSWLTFLQRANPRLSETPVVFRLTQQKAGLEEYSDTQQKQRDKEASQQS